jgi:hypothetical protein
MRFNESIELEFAQYSALKNNFPVCGDKVMGLDKFE